MQQRQRQQQQQPHNFRERAVYGQNNNINIDISHTHDTLSLTLCYLNASNYTHLMWVSVCVCLLCMLYSISLHGIVFSGSFKLTKQTLARSHTINQINEQTNEAAQTNANWTEPNQTTGNENTKTSSMYRQHRMYGIW